MFYYDVNPAWPFSCCGVAQFTIKTTQIDKRVFDQSKTLKDALYMAMSRCKSLWKSPSFAASLPHPNKETEEFLSEIPHIVLEVSDEHIGVFFIAESIQEKNWKFTNPSFVNGTKIKKEYRTNNIEGKTSDVHISL